VKVDKDRKEFVDLLYILIIISVY